MTTYGSTGCLGCDMVFVKQSWNHRYCGDCPMSSPGRRYKFRHPERVAETQQKSRAKRKAWFREYDRKRNLGRYGLTDETYAELVSEQRGLCAVCLGDNDGRKLRVDHCHSSGHVRGLLCDRCNVGLGMFQDDPKKLASAITYLEAA